MTTVDRIDSAEQIDLASHGTFATGHPWAQYAWLRNNDPVYWQPEADGPGFWAMTRYEDVRRVSRQPSCSARRPGRDDGRPRRGPAARSALMMLTMDPPQHDRFKLLVSRGFTPRNAQSLADRVAQLATDIVDDVIDAGRCDLVHDIAGRLPSGLIAELMGIPRADGERVYDLTETMHTFDASVTPQSAPGHEEMLHSRRGRRAQAAPARRRHRFGPRPGRGRR